MAKIGLAEPWFAKRTVTNGVVSYTGGFKCGKAVALSITPQYAEAQLYGDDVLAESATEFKYADISNDTTTVPIEAMETVFGHTVDDTDNSVVFAADDVANFVGQCSMTKVMADNVVTYETIFLPKVKFNDPGESYSTKGDSLEFKTNAFVGKAYAEDDGTWKETAIHTTKAAAIEWMMDKLEIEEE